MKYKIISGYGYNINRKSSFLQYGARLSEIRDWLYSDLVRVSPRYHFILIGHRKLKKDNTIPGEHVGI